jgi:redox-sensitive bicupin YhaK (pirin superfamily)
VALQLLHHFAAADVPNKDMEIVTYVVEGALEHKDSMGNGSVIRPGDVQIMSAGSGVTHSEYNPSKSELVRFLQIWIIPDKNQLSPSYDQKTFGEERRNTLRLVASEDGAENSVRVHRDMRLYASLFDQGYVLDFKATKGRQYWIQVVVGSLTVNAEVLNQGDGLAITDEESLSFRATSECNFLFFDLEEKS